jgi:hypothetical protein
MVGGGYHVIQVAQKKKLNIVSAIIELISFHQLLNQIHFSNTDALAFLKQ